MRKLLASLALASLVATPVWAATQTVTLAVPGMTCAACPITVKTALTKVDGVTKAGEFREPRGHRHLRRYQDQCPGAD